MTDLKGVRIGCVMTGSFCTFAGAFACFKKLKEEGAELFPIMSDNAYALDTRFGRAVDMREAFECISGRPIWHTMQEVEPIGPKHLLDLVLVAPCTGNTLAKLARAVCDSPAVMAVKSHLRNGRPALLSIATNDGLGRSAQSLGMLLPMKNIFFVPFRQDDWFGKPNSLVSELDLAPEAVRAALENRQIQPVLLPPQPNLPDSTAAEK